MYCEQLIYLLSLSLQVSGALILILFCWGNTERRVLNTIYSATSTIHREDDNTVIISKDKLYKAHKEVLLNRNAFIFIAVGYLLSLFGTSDGFCRWSGFAIVLVVSAALVSIGVFLSHMIAKICNRHDRRYEFEDLCSKLYKEVDTNMIKSDIDEICKW